MQAKVVVMQKNRGVCKERGHLVVVPDSYIVER